MLFEKQERCGFMRIIKEGSKDRYSTMPGDVVVLAVDGEEIQVKIREYDLLRCPSASCPLSSPRCFLWVGKLCCDVLEDLVE